MNPSVMARVSRRFAHPPEHVFDAWLDVRKVRRWFGPGFGPVVCVDIDARVGGVFTIVQQRGPDDVEHQGTYLEIARPRRLVFSFRVPPEASTSRVTVQIEPAGRGCELALMHEMGEQWRDAVERTEAAWRSMLDAMADAIGEGDIPRPA
jgi:uncharacterized protein YndB with AHSA1/START domain